MIKESKITMLLSKFNLLKSIGYICIILFLFNCKKTKVNQEDDKLSNAKVYNEELMDLVQKQTFKYFWDFAEPNSGMIRERSHKDAYEGDSNKMITIGGSGFGISCFPIAINRGWVSRQDALIRLDKIITFLENAETYHGAFSHWYMGDTGKTRVFGNQDDGGDIVETAFLIQGLLINKQFFVKDTDEENMIRKRITTIWENVEWNWYTNGKNLISWHWSPKEEFNLNLGVSGWNEALIVYVLAAASPTYPIEKEVYDNGWARKGDMKNGKMFYDHKLPLGEDLGGPLFLSQYSFIGIDPRGLEDKYCKDYFQQNKAHSLINFEYCRANPKGFKGYGENCWGLTASDNHEGYSAHSPTNDLGVITPTAALSSFPYTPKESTKALKHFYERKDELWGEYGFYDAFSDEFNWVADGYLAIDQGPIVAMIENYRTQLLWNIFMKDEDVKRGLKNLGFTSPHI